jgi:hydrogenase expression/formation protein HypC
MCVAIPGRVIKVNDDATAVVDFDGNTVTAMSGLVTVRPDDYVMVHAGCIIQVMNKDEALELKELFSELEEM